MRRKVFVALACCVVASSAQAQSMNAEEFHRRATALKKKGALAVFSGGEIKALMREGEASGKASAAQWKADNDKGHPTRFCPPPGPAKMGSDEYMERLGAIPAAERARINMTEATTRIMAAKFPCPR